ncbi:potassium-transporting ATPase subunit KdpC [Sphingomonas paeninsulae]|jgi:K+-transporting ATPase ATPase C chain|uniref:Potassium-transporting ATPase KdpC subunit n=1 Tax=Sphingomonas paeninsulae TaxID=2319844 RepID=A0A494T9A6_SPHPE|nr:potassium-transporting ATPase subunit KdpC [Sphingomonas paeninsulae]AYJ85947.1 potassium-transporting ATPase subunit KdpC [Sphingomonas paeninsulae]
MLTEIRSALRPAIVLLLLLAGITGLAFPAVITGIAQVVFPAQANGSLIVDDGKVVGSELIAQGFTGAGYFHPRPSAAGKGYDASASSASNLAPGSKDLRDAIATRVAEARAQGMTRDIPADLVTTSASGLDPDLSPEAAFSQVARVAKARGMSETAIYALVKDAISYPALGLIGDPHVNVLMLNRQVDRSSAKSPR